MRHMAAFLYVIVLAALTIWALFWVIRLAVRYGANDALQMNRSWLEAEHPREPAEH